MTDKAGVAGPGAAVSATFADYNNSGKPSLFVAGLDGVRLYRNLGDGIFQDETEKAGLHSIPGELETQAVLFDADDDGFLDLVVTAYTNLNDPPKKDSFLFPNDFAGAATRILSQQRRRHVHRDHILFRAGLGQGAHARRRLRRLR